MKRQKGIVVSCLALIFLSVFCNAVPNVRCSSWLNRRRTHKNIKIKEPTRTSSRKKSGYTKVGSFFVESIKDIFRIHGNLVAWDTFKIGVGTFPFYVTAAMFENELHQKTYCRSCHKNLCQMPDCCHKFAVDFSVGTISAVAVAGFLFARNERVRQTCKQFMIGIPFVIFMADLIKVLIKKDMCYRPWNEHFSSECRSMGGFPSTHGAQFGFATTLFGLQLGMKYAFPLAVLTVCVGASCINGNRHYTSQYIAGIGLGAMYGLAASKVVDSKFLRDIDVGIDCDARGNPALKVSYKF